MAGRLLPMGAIDPTWARASGDEQLSSAEVHVWAVTLDRTNGEYRGLGELLSPDEFRIFIDDLQEVILDRKVTIRIVGHTCDQGRESYNLELGKSRANFVFNTLSASNQNLENASIESKGESDPLVSNATEENRIQNRRVTITIMSEP